MEERLTAFRRLDALVDILPGTPALIAAGEVMALGFVKPFRHRTGDRIDREPVVRVLDRVRAGLEIELVRRAGQREEGVAEAGRPARHAPEGRFRLDAAPGHIAWKERIEHARRRRPAALLWLVDDDRALPRQGVDHQQRVGAGERISRARIEIT